MDPVSISLAIASLLSGLKSSSDAKGSASENLAFQRQNADRNYQLSTATRTDAYGNRLRYDPKLNQWVTELTPQQQAIVSAGEREQRVGLTEDAGRNRDIRRRAEQRGVQAGDAFNKALSGYEYDRPPGEAANRSDILRQIALAMNTGDRATAQLVGRQGLRQQGNMPVINTGSLSPGAGQKLAQALLQARSTSLGETGQREQMHTSKYLPAIQQFNQIANQGGDAPINYSKVPDQFRAETEQAIKGVGDAVTQGGQGVNYASGQLTTASGKNPIDLRGIAGLLRSGTNSAARVTGRDTSGGSGNWTNPDSITPIASGTSYTMPPIIPGRGTTQDLEPWRLSSQSVPGDSWYF